MSDRTDCSVKQNDAAHQGWLFKGTRWRRGRKERSSPTPDDELYLQRIHDFRQLLNGEWVWDVLVALHDGPMQYTNLLHKIREKSTDNGWPGKTHQHIQDSTLNRTLRRLEQGELVKRRRENEFPYHVTYQLMPAARELLVVIVPVVEWAESHGDLLGRVQQRRHDEASGIE